MPMASDAQLEMMEEALFIGETQSSSFPSTSSAREEKYCLQYLETQKRNKRRARAFLGHCLSRRTTLCTVALLVVLAMALTTQSFHHRQGRALSLVNFEDSGQELASVGDKNIELIVTEADTPECSDEDEDGEEGEDREDDTGGEDGEDDWIPDWVNYRYLGGYFRGLKALVPLHKYVPEYPRVKHDGSPPPLTRSGLDIPVPVPYFPQPNYQYGGYTTKYNEVKTCYLDIGKTTPVPSLYAYKGVVQGQPEAVIGSRSLLKIRDDVCFDRFGRYGPYGMGYSLAEGGLDVGMDTENAASDAVWSKTGKIDYSRINWGDAQDRCYEANKRRFPRPSSESSSARPGQHQTISRTAVVVRAYVGVDWTPHVILNFRALISEVALRSGGEYQVHFLLHVRDDDEPIWASPAVAQQILDDNVPAEFHDLCTLWSEAEMRLLYPGAFNESFSNPSNTSVHGVYRGAHLPLQHFAMQNPQYAHFWNWEMDMRWVGNYYELFDRLDVWAREQTRVEMWERAQKYYIPHFHGDWDNFTRLVHDETLASGQDPIFGPVRFLGRVKTNVEKLSPGGTFLPATCHRSGDDWEDLHWRSCGVGEDADLITLNPIFDTQDSGWVFDEDVTGYNTSLPIPPRRSAIITASRLSRRLLEVMHEETWRNRHAMFSEMFPPTMALHHGLKVVYAPHPVYLDREWELDVVDSTFNGGRNHSTSGAGSPFGYDNEHSHKGTSWYYHSAFAGQLWRRWLGYAQMDGRGLKPGNFSDGRLRGGREEEERGSGRMCLRSMLVHPIKWEDPSEK